MGQIYSDGVGQYYIGANSYFLTRRKEGLAAVEAQRQGEMGEMVPERNQLAGSLVLMPLVRRVRKPDTLTK